jgi:hypothetical protein
MNRVRAEDAGTEPAVPEGETPPPPLEPEYADAEEYVGEVDPDRPDGHLEDEVEQRVDERRETLRGDSGATPGM